MLIMGSSLLCAGSIFAQQEAAQSPAADEASNTDEDVVYLNPFEVTEEGSIGYQSRETLAGTRLRTDLNDVANAIQVVNTKFLEDTNATDTKSLLIYTTNTEVGGVGGNFGNTGQDSQPNNRLTTSPQSNTRVRGLDAADNTRNFVLTRLPWDSYNVNHVDIQRGANAILLGIGSPAGIINVGLNDAEFYNKGTIETRVGSYGSIRGSVNVNQMLLDGQLAVRVAGLYDDEEYQQRPAFDLDRRVYLAVKYDPKWARIGSSRLTIKMNYEHGNIEANRPRNTPPVDRISPWWSELNQNLYDCTNAQSNVYEDYLSTYDGDGTDGSYYNLSYGAMQSTLKCGTKGDHTYVAPDGTTTVTSYLKNTEVTSPNYTPWLTEQSSYYTIAGVFNADSPTQTSLVHGSGTTYPGDSSTNTDYNPAFMGIVTSNTYLTNTDAAAANLYRSNMITNTGLYDYYNKLLDGETKRELEKWQAFNLDISHTFFDNLFGYQLTFDYQMDKQTYKDALSDYSIGIDVSTTLADGSANPNAGRAYVSSQTSYNSSDAENQRTLRATAFIDFDLKKYFDEDAWWVKILGRQIIQGNYTHTQEDHNVRSWYGAVYDASGEGDATSPTSRVVGKLVYISGDLTKTTSASQAHCSTTGGSKYSTSGTATYFDSEGNIVSKDVTIWNDSNSEDMSHLYYSGGCYNTRTITDTWGIVWNAYMLNFDETDGWLKYIPQVVPTYGYRKDRQTFGTTGSAGYSTVDGNQEVDFTSENSDWHIPNSADDTSANSSYRSVPWRSSDSWGVVVHMPEALQKKMPAGLNLSVFFNKSSNWKPTASRVDIYGDPIDSQTGDTKDYGFTISALDERLMLKVNWYDSNVKNASVGSDGTYITGIYEIAQLEFEAFCSCMNAQYGLGSEYSSAITEWQNDDDYAGIDCPYKAGTDDLGNTYSSYEECLDIWTRVSKAMMDPDNWPSDKFQNAWYKTGYTFSGLIDLYAEKMAADPTDSAGWKDTLDQYWTGGNNNNAALTCDTHSEGVEIELAAQITPNWNVAINASETTASRLRFAESYVEITENRNLMYQTDYGKAQLWDGASWTQTLYSRWLGYDGGSNPSYYPNYLAQRMLEGSDVPELCKWRFNVVTNYTFSEGTFKGVNVGCGYRWQGKNVIGYAGQLDEATEMYIYDIDHKYYNSNLDYIDAWIGYEHPINDKITWKIQVNLKNVMNKDDLIPTYANPDGSIAYYRIPEGRTWYITNTFTF
jgi:hypothetical protein